MRGAARGCRLMGRGDLLCCDGDRHGNHREERRGGGEGRGDGGGGGLVVTMTGNAMRGGRDLRWGAVSRGAAAGLVVVVVAEGGEGGGGGGGMCDGGLAGCDGVCSLFFGDWLSVLWQLAFACRGRERCTREGPVRELKRTGRCVRQLASRRWAFL